MKVIQGTTCRFCEKIFCCPKCRLKHELKVHAIIVRNVIGGCESEATTDVSSSIGARDINIPESANGIVDKLSDDDIAAFNIPDEFVTKSETFVLCPICLEKPLPLRMHIYLELLEHIERQHLPLYCQKCAKAYTNISELKDFSQCLHTIKSIYDDKDSTNETNDTDNSTDDSKATVTKGPTKVTISTQTSPKSMHSKCEGDGHGGGGGGGVGGDGTNSEITHSVSPYSPLKLDWKAKNKIILEEFISDSVSSIRNLSSVSSSSGAIGSHTVDCEAIKTNHIKRILSSTANEKKLVPPSSTPVQFGMALVKPKQQNLITYGGTHVSSIYNSGIDIDNSPFLIPRKGQMSSGKQIMDNINSYHKMSGRTKITAATPLRQVMSKSIQKAFAEHGLPTGNGNCSIQNRFDVFDASFLESPGSNNLSSGPLDLRLSPAIKRTQMEIKRLTNSNINSEAFTQNKILLSSQKLTTESIVITRTQHTASIKTSSSSSSTRSQSSSQVNFNQSLSTNSSNASEQSTSSSTSSNSVFKSCHSVEIITATELSGVKVRRNTYTSGRSKSFDQITPLSLLTADGNSLDSYNTAFTPITRIPGAVINKKLIQFDEITTPNTSNNDSSKNSINQSLNDVFSTPSGTPSRKSNIDNECRTNIPRNLSGDFSLPISKCTNTKSLNHIENNEYEDIFKDVDSVYDDGSNGELISTIEYNNNNNNNKSFSPSKKQNPGGIWSLVSSVIRLPSFKNVTAERTGATAVENKREKKKNELGKLTSNPSLLKRCASIAGSLVRSQSMTDEELQPQKRKRTYTADNYCYVSVPPEPSHSDVSSTNRSKRFRIQGRKPIDRMRVNK